MKFNYEGTATIKIRDKTEPPLRQPGITIVINHNGDKDSWKLILEQIKERLNKWVDELGERNYN